MLQNATMMSQCDFFNGVIVPTLFENPTLDLSPYISGAYREEESNRQINPGKLQW